MNNNKKLNKEVFKHVEYGKCSLSTMLNEILIPSAKTKIFKITNSNVPVIDSSPKNKFIPATGKNIISVLIILDSIDIPNTFKYLIFILATIDNDIFKNIACNNVKNIHIVEMNKSIVIGSKCCILFFLL